MWQPTETIHIKLSGHFLAPTLEQYRELFSRYLDELALLRQRESSGEAFEFALLIAYLYIFTTNMSTIDRQG